MPAVDSKSERELLLLVEGINDCHAVFQLMWLVHRADPVFGIHECGNDDKVLDSLAARVISPSPKPKVLGLILRFYCTQSAHAKQGFRGGTAPLAPSHSDTSGFYVK